MGKVYGNYKRRVNKYGVLIDAQGKAERTIDGIVFASKSEKKRYGELKLLERAGKISGLTLQWPFRLNVLGVDNLQVTIGKYIADFCYRTEPDFEMVVEDCKGFRVPLYKWKKKHFEIQYGIKITEVK